MEHYEDRRRGCRNLTGPQREPADRLAVHAEAGWGGEAWSVREAVALAAIQLGPHDPAQA
ncbi:hypothetical protein ACFQ9J_32770 [Streptomyces sp. NPDC056529]|uniref:hypothetical protein n=1 Tax=Streptomyces sp. NPDC056529 TaxID=3345855 RepID=UPI0036A09D25